MKKLYILCSAIVTMTTSAFAAAPSISAISNTNILEDAEQLGIAFTVTDSDSDIFSVSTTASSSDTNVVPNDASGLSVDGLGENRAVFITPTANASGTTTITITATDEA